MQGGSLQSRRLPAWTPTLRAVSSMPGRSPVEPSEEVVYVLHVADDPLAVSGRGAGRGCA